jgi:hypothetical protein
MLIENAFAVAAPVDRLWTHLLDVQRIVPCLPGAELTETVDDRTWKGRFHVTFGPVAMAFAGTVTMESRDDQAHRVVLRARGMEERGRGAAEARVTAWLETTAEDATGPGARGEAATQVRVRSDIALSGAVAQLSRGLLPEISRRLTQEFADRLEAILSGEAAAPVAAEGALGTAAPRSVEPAPASGPGSVRPVGGIRLALQAAWGSIRAFIRRFFRRVFRRGPEGE